MSVQPPLPPNGSELGLQPDTQAGFDMSVSVAEAHILKALTHIAAAIALEAVEGGPDLRAEAIRSRLVVLAGEISALVSRADPQLVEIQPLDIQSALVVVPAEEEQDQLQDESVLAPTSVTDANDSQGALDEVVSTEPVLVLAESHGLSDDQPTAQSDEPATGTDTDATRASEQSDDVEEADPELSKNELDPDVREAHIVELGRLFGVAVDKLTDGQLLLLFQEFSKVYTALSIRRLSADAKKARVDQIQMRVYGASNKAIGVVFGLSQSAVHSGLTKVADSFQKRLTQAEREQIIHRVAQTLEDQSGSKPVEPVVEQEVEGTSTYQDHVAPVETSKGEQVVTIRPRELRVDGVEYEITPDESKILRFLRGQTQSGHNVTAKDVAGRLFASIASERETHYAVEEALFELVQKGFLREVSEVIPERLSVGDSDPIIELKFAFNPKINETRRTIHRLHVGDKDIFVNDNDVAMLEILLSSSRTYEPSELVKGIYGERVTNEVHFALVRSLKKYFVAQGLVYRQKSRFANDPARFGIKDEVRIKLDRALDYIRAERA